MTCNNSLYVDFGPEKCYRIYRDGRLFSNPKGKFLSDKVSRKHQYITNSLKGYDIPVYRHHLVAKYFITNPRPDIFTDIDHIDRNKTNNKASNLRYCTSYINMLNRESDHITPDKRCVAHPYQSKLNFLKRFHHLKMCGTEQEAIHLNNRIRKQLFTKLYNYRTRPMCYLTPAKWSINSKGVRAH